MHLSIFRYTLFLLISCCLLSSCSESKRASRQAKKAAKKEAKKATTNTNKQDSQVSLFQQELDEKALSPDFFKAKAKVSYKIPGESQSFNAEIRLQKDKMIWVSIYPPFLKIELGRAVITRDSVKVLDRFNKKYYRSDLSYIEEIIGYQPDFETLQNIILGNRIVTEGESELIEEATHFQLLTTGEEFTSNVYVEPTAKQISKMHISQEQENRQIEIVLGDYATVNGKDFAHKRNIKVQTNEQYTVDIKMSKVKADEPLNFPFSVSKKYQLVE